MRKLTSPFFTQVLRAAVFFCCLPNLLLAADGKITGRVLDRDTREPLPGTNVVITHGILSDGAEVPLHRPMAASTDVNGYYFILNVPSGTYVLRASMVGYAPVVQRLVRVRLRASLKSAFFFVS